MGFNLAFKGLNIKFHENPSNGKLSSSMRINRPDETNSHFLQFCKRA